MIVMAVAALIAWMVTAVGGFVLLGTWIAKGGGQQPRASHLPPAVILGHFLLAAAGLVVWVGYLILAIDVLAWAGFIILLPVAALGFTMLARWVPVYRAPATAGRTGGGAATASGAAPPEQHFPPAVVGGHGVLAVATLVLVLLTALGIGR